MSRGSDGRSISPVWCRHIWRWHTGTPGIYFGPEYRTYINRFFNVAVSPRPCATCTFFFLAVAAVAAVSIFPFYLSPFYQPWRRFDKWQSSEKLEVSGFCRSLVLLSETPPVAILINFERIIDSLSRHLIHLCLFVRTSSRAK